VCVQVSSGSDEPVRSLASRWPPSAGSHVGDDAWGSASDRGGVAAGHLRQLTINTGWSASTQPRHVQVCLSTCFVWHDTIHTIPYDTHTHPFNGPLSGYPGELVPERKNQSGFTEQETVSGSGISWAIRKSAPRSRQITTPAPHHSVFYRPAALPAAQQTASKHCEGIRYNLIQCDRIYHRALKNRLLAGLIGAVLCSCQTYFAN